MINYAMNIINIINIYHQVHKCNCFNKLINKSYNIYIYIFLIYI